MLNSEVNKYRIIPEKKLPWYFDCDKKEALTIINDARELFREDIDKLM